jgi:hypothetical protein
MKPHGTTLVKGGKAIKLIILIEISGAHTKKQIIIEFNYYALSV